MAKLYFNTRDELVCVDSDLVAVAKADGNYSKVFYITGFQIHLNCGISQLEEMLKASSSRNSRFIRLGRSYIVNHAYFFKIEVLKQTLYLFDGYKESLKVPMSRQTLKIYKEAIQKGLKNKKPTKKKQSLS